MGDEASNTLLKTLEEPSGDTMLILTTAHKDALLPTILSRCQNIRFDPLSEDDIRTALVQRNNVQNERATLVARLANGSYTRAEDLLGDDVEGERQEVVNFIRHALSSSATVLNEDVERVVDRKDRDLINQFLVLMLMWFRDAFVLSNGGNIINLDQQEDLKRFVARFPSADLVTVLADVERAISLLERNVYIKLVLIDLAFRLKTHILHPENA
jgi:DNA polymerase-3 subunit delta'